MSSLVPSSSSHASTPRTSINTDSILSQIDMEQHYEVKQQLGRGSYGKCVLVSCKETGKLVVLKLLDKKATKMKDFLHELNTSIFLSAHPNIIDAFSVAFETPEFYTFTLEFAPLGDLFEFIQPNRGLEESMVKSVAAQLASALEFMHSQQLCHRDVKPENVAVFEPDLSLVKLADFGMTRNFGSLVRKTGNSIPYTPPEIALAVKNETYRVHPATDVWSFGVLLFCCLIGSFPWQVAKESDEHFHEFWQWQRRRTLKVPPTFREFTPRLQKFFRKVFEPRQQKRAAIGELTKFLKDDWTVLIGGRPVRSCPGPELDEQFDSARLERMLQKFGVKTRVSRKAKEQRVEQWLSCTTPTADTLNKD